MNRGKYATGVIATALAVTLVVQFGLMGVIAYAQGQGGSNPDLSKGYVPWWTPVWFLPEILLLASLVLRWRGVRRGHRPRHEYQVAALIFLSAFIVIPLNLLTRGEILRGIPPGLGDLIRELQ